MDTGFGYVAGYPAAVNDGFHVGEDYPTPVGTPLVACAGGQIVEVGNFRPVGLLHLPTEGLVGFEYVADGAWGLAVSLQTAPDTIVDFCHLSAVQVHVGDMVARGQPLGFTGRSGLVTGAHLHCQVRRLMNGGWVRVDPDPCFRVN